MPKESNDHKQHDFVKEQPRMQTGIEGLDIVLEGGVPSGHLYLVEGEPGTGKTTLALQFLREGVRRRESVLYVTLSETKNELINVAGSHGWSLDGVEIFELVPAGDALKTESQYTIFHPSEVELNETTSAVLNEVDRLSPTRVVFDSLSEMRLLARDPLRYRRQILALKQFFAPRDATVLLLDDKTSNIVDLQVSSIVHGVLEMQHLAVEYGAERRRLRMLKLRGSKFRGGYHDFTIETGGVEVYPRLVSADHVRNTRQDTQSTGVPQLDRLIGGGLDRGTSTLIIGPAGSGKSSLAAHIAVSAASTGDKASVFIFDEIRETYIKRSTGLGLDIETHLNSGHIALQQVDPAELSPGEFAHSILESVRRDNTNVVIIDSLNGYLNAMPEERFLTIQMHEILTYLNRQGVITILIMAQHGFLGVNMSSSVDVSYLADTVLMMRYFEAKGAILRALSVVKKRTGAHESTIREIEFSSEGIRVGKALTDFQGVLTGVPVYVGKEDKFSSDMNAEN